MSRKRILCIGIALTCLCISFHLLLYERDQERPLHLSQKVIRQLQQKVTEIPSDLTSTISKRSWDASGEYVLHTFNWLSEKLEPTSSNNTCLATHTTVNGLHWVAKQAKYFKGHISVAVFTPGRDINIATKMILYLRHCHPEVKDLVNFHFIYPITNQAIYENGTLDTPGDYFCGDPEGFNLRLNQERREADKLSCQLYPQNIARNFAWSNCRSGHVLNVDVDMIPTDGLGPMLQGFFSHRKNCGECAYVVPVYEIKNREDFPVKEKRQLLSLLEKKLAQRFHVTVYDKNQLNSNLKQWEKLPQSSSLDVMYSIPKYEEYWEPIMVLDASAPKFLERFIGYGFTRSSHMYLLNSKKFSFKVLDLAFLSHLGFQTRKHYPDHRRKQVKLNSILYKKFKNELKENTQKNKTTSKKKS